jgi:hypothetical protein
MQYTQFYVQIRYLHLIKGLLIGWSGVGGGFLGALPHSQVNDTVGDVHREGRVTFWLILINFDHQWYPWHWEQQLLQRHFSIAVKKYPWSYKELKATPHQERKEKSSVKLYVQHSALSLLILTPCSITSKRLTN